MPKDEPLGVRELRPLFVPEQPFALGVYPNRPAPAHVANRFVERWLGDTGRGKVMLEWLNKGSSLPVPLQHLDREKAARDQFSWGADPAITETLREDLNVVINPDRRAWGAIGSVVPVHAAFTTRDASDNGLGSAIAELVRAQLTEAYRDDLQGLVTPTAASSPLDSLGIVLARGSGSTTLPGLGRLPAAWFVNGSPSAASTVAGSFSEFLRALTGPPSHPVHRTAQIQHLSRGLFVCATLSVFYGPIAQQANGGPKCVGDLMVALAIGSLPPGPAGGALVSASARSLRRLVEQAQGGMAATLAGALLKGVPSGTAAGKAQRAALLTRYKMQQIKKAEDLVDRILKTPAVAEHAGKPVDDIDFARAIVELAYPTKDLVAGLRTMGRKIGLVGPDRSAGVPRFLAETPLLGTLVAGLCPPEGIEYTSFIDVLRNRLGLVFGEGSDPRLADRMNLWGSAGLGRQILATNQEDLRRRLVRSGLAKEYSDGHTEVLPYA